MNTQFAPHNSGKNSKADDRAIAEAYVWATNEESKRQGMLSYLIRSIAQRHGGNAHVDFFEQSIDINVPNEEKLACTREIQEKVGLPVP
ncbi:MAG: hypothetical protein ACYTBV_11945 [Planctomycetota bacterium]|jgi:hypothetical protein